MGRSLVGYTPMGYMQHLDTVTALGNAVIVQKTQTYSDSWKRRGGAGAWFTTVRPWDRLEKIVSDHGGDIFAAIEADPSGDDGSALACVRDIRNYLTLIEAEMISRGVVSVEGSVFDPAERIEVWRAGTPEDGGQHALFEDAGGPSSPQAVGSQGAGDGRVPPGGPASPGGLEGRGGVTLIQSLELVSRHMKGWLGSMGVDNPDITTYTLTAQGQWEMSIRVRVHP